jgi:hypothetical protein
MRRTTCVGAALALVAPALSGCLSLQATEVVKQTTPGKVTIRTVVCASDYPAPPTPALAWSDCQPTNIAEGDNDRTDATQAGTGHLLVGFRVPRGTDGPPSFLTTNGAFSRSDTYTRELVQSFPPPADQQWIGYISTNNSFNPAEAKNAAAARSVEFAADFTLPSSAAPLTGPFRWRTVVGFQVGDPAAEVVCPDDAAKNQCFDSPTPGQVLKDIPTPVSDFGLLGGTTTTVFPGTTAVVPFKLRYADAANLGRKSFSLGAEADMPQTNARPDPQTLSANSNSTTDVTAKVPVPTNMPAGRYPVTLTGGTGTPPVTRAATATIVVASLPQGTKPLPASGNVSLITRLVRSGRGRKIIRLVVTGIPRGGTVTALCRRGCAFKSKKIKRRRTVNLARFFRGRTLRPQTVVNLTVTGPKRIGKEFRITIRKVQRPIIVRCRPPGAKKALECEGVVD